jgi:hypothetical protein
MPSLYDVVICASILDVNLCAHEQNSHYAGVHKHNNAPEKRLVSAVTNITTKPVPFRNNGCICLLQSHPQCIVLGEVAR